MKAEIRSNIIAKSDHQLLAVLCNSQDYVPEAIDFAIEELEKRGFNENDIMDAFSEGEIKMKTFLERKDVPLTMNEKRLYFIFSFLLFTPVVFFTWLRFSSEGYDRKSNESMEMTGLGLLFYIAVISLINRLFF